MWEASGNDMVPRSVALCMCRGKRKGEAAPQEEGGRGTGVLGVEERRVEVSS